MKNVFAKTAVVASTVMLATAAHAQSSVTLYGIADAGLIYQSKTQSPTGGNGGRLLGFTDSGMMPSLFGLKGDEDLGGGLHAEFNLESGIDMANGGFSDSNGNMWGRQAWVGLRGNFGTVRAGLQYSPFFMQTLALDPRSLSQLGSSLVVYANNAIATGIFVSNAVTYTTPVIAGLQGSALFAFGGTPGNFQAGRQYSGSLSYHWQNLGLYASYFNGNAGGTAPVPTVMPLEASQIGATYKFGAVTAKASFVNFKMAGAGVNNDVYNAGFDYLVLPMVDVNAGVWFQTNRDDTSSKSVMGAVGTQYFLSKATALYAQLGVVNNKGTQNLGLDMGGGPTMMFAPQGTTVGANVGIRHLF